MSIWTIIAILISHLYVSRKIIFLKLNKYLLILWWILLIMGVLAYSLHTYNYKPDPNRMLDMNTDETIIFYAIFPLTAPFLWAYIIYMAFIPVKLIINIYKHPNKNETIWIKNIFTYILLLIISGIMYSIYYKIMERIDVIQYFSISAIIFFCLLIIISNIIGIIYSIMNIKKVEIQIIYFGIILISTLLLKELMSIIVNSLIKNNNITDSSIILFNGLLIIVENVISMVTIKILLNKVRGNCT
jgi:hypothetical protein